MSNSSPMKQFPHAGAQPNNNPSAVCTNPLPAPSKAERIDILIGLCLLGTEGQIALIQYIKTKQTQKEQKGITHV